MNRLDELENEARKLRADTDAAQARIDAVNAEIATLRTEIASKRADGWLPLEDVHALAAARAQLEATARAILDRSETFDGLTDDEVIKLTLAHHDSEGREVGSVSGSDEYLRARFDALAVASGGHT